MCVLVVEDEFLIRCLLVEELKAVGLTVLEASTAGEAIDMLRTIHPPLRVLVTDIHMPGRKDGVDLAAYVKERLPEVPIFFTTGRPDVLDGTGIPGKNETLIGKPYSFTELALHVAAIIKNEKFP